MDVIKPREKLFQPPSLTETELLALLLGTGSPVAEPGRLAVLALAERLLLGFGDLWGVFRASGEELRQVIGIGPAKEGRLLAVAEILKRVGNARVADCVVRSSADAYALFRELAWEPQEVVSGAFLDCRNRLIRRKVIFRGTLESAPARPREILREALRANAARLVVAHNHPSGSLEPSEEDMLFTTKLSGAAEMVGIRLLDHLIVGAGGKFFSFADAMPGTLSSALKRTSRPVLAPVR
jgi:DNA repair protein RadC